MLSLFTGYSCKTNVLRLVFCDFLASMVAQTLLLGFNSLSDLSDLPWVALTSLESLDLSSNRLRTLGDVVLMTWLRRLNLENNEISPVPLELGLCTGEHTVDLRCALVSMPLLSQQDFGIKSRLSVVIYLVNLI